MARTVMTGPFDDCEIAVEIDGPADAPVLVWLHGEFGMLDGVPLSADQRDGMRVIAPHLPGWGVSTGAAHFDRLEHLATGIWWLLDELGVDASVIAGHGLGATLAAEVASQQPGRVEALVMAAPFGVFDADDPGVDLFATLPKDVMPELFDDVAGPVAAAHFPPPSDARDQALANIARVRALGAASRYLFPVPDTGFAERAYRLRDVPTTLLFGGRDGIVPVSLVAQWEKLVPHADVRVVDGGRHHFAYETGVLGEVLGSSVAALTAAS